MTSCMIAFRSITLQVKRLLQLLKERSKCIALSSSRLMLKHAKHLNVQIKNEHVEKVCICDATFVTCEMN